MVGEVDGTVRGVGPPRMSRRVRSCSGSSGPEVVDDPGNPWSVTRDEQPLGPTFVSHRLLFQLRLDYPDIPSRDPPPDPCRRAPYRQYFIRAPRVGGSRVVTSTPLVSRASPRAFGDFGNYCSAPTRGAPFPKEMGHPGSSSRSVTFHKSHLRGRWAGRSGPGQASQREWRRGPPRPAVS